jgi:hypothetical protein
LGNEDGVTLYRDHERGEVAVADDAPELLLGVALVLKGVVEYSRLALASRLRKAQRSNDFRHIDQGAGAS